MKRETKHMSNCYSLPTPQCLNAFVLAFDEQNPTKRLVTFLLSQEKELAAAFHPPDG